MQYTGGASGPGLDARVSGLRIMDPDVAEGPSPGYPGGSASYSNAAGQTVNPLTGRTIGPSNPWCRTNGRLGVSPRWSRLSTQLFELPDAKRKKTWWQRNRPDAVELFEQELNATLEGIAVAPAIGQRVEQRGGDVLVRRWLMPKTRDHAYYAVEATEIVVLSFWGAPRGRKTEAVAACFGEGSGAER